MFWFKLWFFGFKHLNFGFVGLNFSFCWFKLWFFWFKHCFFGLNTGLGQELGFQHLLSDSEKIRFWAFCAGPCATDSHQTPSAPLAQCPHTPSPRHWASLCPHSHHAKAPESPHLKHIHTPCPSILTLRIFQARLLSISPSLLMPYPTPLPAFHTISWMSPIAPPSLLNPR